jgi:hypothetical protein
MTDKLETTEEIIIDEGSIQKLIEAELEQELIEMENLELERQKWRYANDG